MKHRVIALSRAGLEANGGARKDKTPDGEFPESITLNYDKEPISGFPINQVSVSYSGEDPALVWPRQLSIQDVRPILNRWGYVAKIEPQA